MKINSNDMDALIALGVSYTNEMYREEALEALGKESKREKKKRGREGEEKSEEQKQKE